MIFNIVSRVKSIHHQTERPLFIPLMSKFSPMYRNEISTILVLSLLLLRHFKMFLRFSSRLFSPARLSNRSWSIFYLAEDRILFNSIIFPPNTRTYKHACTHFRISDRSDQISSHTHIHIHNVKNQKNFEHKMWQLRTGKYIHTSEWTKVSKNIYIRFGNLKLWHYALLADRPIIFWFFILFIFRSLFSKSWNLTVIA